MKKENDDFAANSQHVTFQKTGAARRIKMNTWSGFAENRFENMYLITSQAFPGGTLCRPVVYSVDKEQTEAAGMIRMPLRCPRIVKSRSERY
jgi:hypothetical protein